MMKNKIIVNIYVPSLDNTYEVVIPSNETISKILKTLIKIITDSSDSDFDFGMEHFLLDPYSLEIYSENLIIRDTNIKNSKLLLLV